MLLVWVPITELPVGVFIIFKKRKNMKHMSHIFSVFGHKYLDFLLHDIEKRTVAIVCRRSGA